MASPSMKRNFELYELKFLQSILKNVESKGITEGLEEITQKCKQKAEKAKCLRETIREQIEKRKNKYKYKKVTKTEMVKIVKKYSEKSKEFGVYRKSLSIFYDRIRKQDLIKKIRENVKTQIDHRRLKFQIGHKKIDLGKIKYKYNMHSNKFRHFRNERYQQVYFLQAQLNLANIQRENAMEKGKITIKIRLHMKFSVRSNEFRLFRKKQCEFVEELQEEFDEDVELSLKCAYLDYQQHELLKLLKKSAAGLKIQSTKEIMKNFQTKLKNISEHLTEAAREMSLQEFKYKQKIEILEENLQEENEKNEVLLDYVKYLENQLLKEKAKEKNEVKVDDELGKINSSKEHISKSVRFLENVEFIIRSKQCESYITEKLLSNSKLHNRSRSDPVKILSNFNLLKNKVIYPFERYGRHNEKPLWKFAYDLQFIYWNPETKQMYWSPQIDSKAPWYSHDGELTIKNILHWKNMKTGKIEKFDKARYF